MNRKHGLTDDWHPWAPPEIDVDTLNEEDKRALRIAFWENYMQGHPELLKLTYRIEGQNIRANTWENLREFAVTDGYTLEDARLALADSQKFPMDRDYRIVEIRETVVI